MFGGGFDVEAEDDVFADEVVGFAGVFHVEIEALDGEVGFDSDGVVFDFDVGGEGDLFGDAVEGEVASDFGIGAGAGDVGGFEDCGREFGGIEEVGALEVAGEAIVVTEEGVGLNGDFGVGDGVTGGVNLASELFEAAVVFAGDFGPGEFDFGVFGGDGVGLRGGSRAGGGGSTGGRVGGDAGGRDAIGRVGTGSKEKGQSQRETQSLFKGVHRHHLFFAEHALVDVGRQGRVTVENWLNGRELNGVEMGRVDRQSGALK